MNRVCLVGRITSKPELRYTTSNIAVTRFSLAVNRTYSKDGEQKADFINIQAWRKQAENVCKYLDKGSLVSIEGRIQTGSYEKEDGTRNYTFEVLAESVQFLETKKNAQKNENTVQNYEENDPFEDFGKSVSIDDNFLD